MSTYNTRAEEARAAAKGRKKLSDVGAAAYFVAILAATVAIVPVLYVIYSAFRSSAQLAAHPRQGGEHAGGRHDRVLLVHEQCEDCG